MATHLKTTSVKGGSIKRDVASGRVVEVRSGSAVSKASPKSQDSIKEASSKRREALKRLADR